MAMKFFAVLFCLGIFAPTVHHAQSPRVISLVEELDELIYGVQYDSAHKLVRDFLDLEDLTPEESFHGMYLYGRSLRSGGRPEDAIEQFQNALSFIDVTREENLDYHSAVRSQLAECYFDMQDFDRAAINAEASIQLTPEPKFRNTGHAINYLILGYVDFLSPRRKSATERPRKSIDRGEWNANCPWLPPKWPSCTTNWETWKWPINTWIRQEP